MGHEYLARALVELMQIGKTSGRNEMDPPPMRIGFDEPQ